MAPLVAAFVASAFSPGPRAAAPSADEVIAKLIAARGGRAKLASVHTARLFGIITFANGAGGPLVVSIARPPRIRSQFTMNGRTMTQGYDGHIAWLFDGSASHPLTPDQSANVAAGADFDGPLVDYAAKGNQVALVGLDTADGRPAYDVRVTLASGLVDDYFIDTVTWMQTKWRGGRKEDTVAVVYESWFRDYRRIGGVKFAFRIDSRTVGRAGSQLIALDSVQVNPKLAPDLFTMPPSKPDAKE